ncbi:N-acetyltransferase eso1 [Spiromyces aspiralis]|uniref:N-acetyltransferase eso1 n=1 Tax=Spiromyces aspiralis TaxID=68401 RepID=A0ACC1HWW5_9FUNG|nr:N-acetyltransferase eso1 [Spiromyces aspiralis]
MIRHLLAADEVYLDLTNTINGQILRDFREGKVELSSNPETFSEPLVRWRAGDEDIGVLEGDDGVSATTGWGDLQLLYAAQYTLAKLATSRNKPQNQTILRKERVLEFLDATPIKNIRMLGGKLGKKVVSEYQITTAGELRQYPLHVLKMDFPANHAQFLYNICRGIDDTEGRLKVGSDKRDQLRGILKQNNPKSVMSAKTFRKPYPKNTKDIEPWAGVMGMDLWTRVREKWEGDRLWPSTLTVSIAMLSAVSRVFGFSLVPLGEEMNAQMPKLIAMEIVKGMTMIAKKAPLAEPLFPIIRMSAQMSGFKVIEQKQNLGRWFAQIPKSEGQRFRHHRPANDENFTLSPQKPDDKSPSLCRASQQTGTGESGGAKGVDAPACDGSSQRQHKQCEQPVDAVMIVRCLQCPPGSSQVPVGELAEHRDYHLALELHEREVQKLSAERVIQQAFARSRTPDDRESSRAKKSRQASVTGVHPHPRETMIPQKKGDGESGADTRQKSLFDFWQTAGERRLQ